MNIVKIAIHTFISILLTLLTQIGGLLYLLSIFLVTRDSKNRRIKKAGLFVMLYLLATFLIVPLVAPFFGRVKLKDTDSLQARSFIYKVLNRDYVTPTLSAALYDIATTFEKENKGIKLVYLDANFPFINGFPLLPHLSHNDGKKIDVSFIYKDATGKLTNKKPSVSGYGVYEAPVESEFNQTKACKEKGYWQYDFSKYITLGSINKELKLSKKATMQLINGIVNRQEVKKVFIEPHLKKRFGLKNFKVRFHGCLAVRHDDHIHLQV